MLVGYARLCLVGYARYGDICVLKGLAQAKIIKKSVILFWLLNMTIWCKHVHRLELQIPVFLIFDMVVNN